MKFFNKKNWFSLVELIISMVILAFIMIAIMAFMNSSSESLVNTNKEIDTSKTVLWFKNTMDKIQNQGYSEFEIMTGTGYDSVLFFTPKLDKAVLLWVIDLWTKKLKQSKTYGENYIWYRPISKEELVEIRANPSKINEKEFQADKIFNLSVIRDFDPRVYTWSFLTRPVLDLDFSIFTYSDDYFYWKTFKSLEIPLKDYTYNYNLVF